jgi:hypothetical protein
MNGHTIIFFVTLLAAVLSSEPALAFPQMIRHGAPCEACHVSPSGGGALTEYGRANAAASSTWGSEDAARPFYGLPETPALSFGGDQRLVRLVSARDGETPTYLTIPMQYDAELAVTPVPAITFDAAWGVYGPDFEEGSRRHYVMGRLGDHVTARVGRFFAAYGLGEPDHTTYARRALGFDEGKETINGEVAFHADEGDVFVTAIYGRDPTFSASPKKGYDTDTDDESGVAVRLQAYAWGQSLVGVSCLAVESYEAQRRACGVHGVVTFTPWLFGTFDANRLITEDDYAASGQLTAEPYRGVLLGLQGEAMQRKRRVGLSLQWFPLPHIEVEALGRREERADGVVSYTAIFMGHHYL